MDDVVPKLGNRKKYMEAGYIFAGLEFTPAAWDLLLEKAQKEAISEFRVWIMQVPNVGDLISVCFERWVLYVKVVGRVFDALSQEAPHPKSVSLLVSIEFMLDVPLSDGGLFPDELWEICNDGRR